jgi:hypothetical protein
MHRKCKLFSLIQDELIVENGHCLVYDGLPYQKLDMSSQFKFPAGFMFFFTGSLPTSSATTASSAHARRQLKARPLINGCKTLLFGANTVVSGFDSDDKTNPLSFLLVEIPSYP